MIIVVDSYSPWLTESKLSCDLFTSMGCGESMSAVISETIESPRLASDTVSRLSQVEVLLHTPDVDLAEVRQVIRTWLIEQSGEDGSASIADVLRHLASQRTRDTRFASVILRALAVEGLLPEPNASNNLARSIVTIVEIALPNFCEFLKIQAKQQTFEKFAILESAHDSVCAIIDPLREEYGDLDALIAAKRTILGGLAHGAVRTYCAPFRLNEIKATIETIFSKLKQVLLQEPSLLDDYQDCKRAIESAKDSIVEIGSFLSYDFLLPFLQNAESCLTKYLDTMTARFSTSIKNPAGNTVQTLGKRYPLREKERELQLIIPLKNIGPGMATDVKITITSDTESIYVPSNPIYLGNVNPGEFSVVTEAIVISPVPDFSGVIHVSWGEIGTVVRHEEMLGFAVNSQTSDIDWQAKTYWAPYSTDVAEGDDFVGRAERIRHTASKVLRSPMEPFYITGQKRVGKTSLVKAAAEFAASEEKALGIETKYILWGAVAHADPKESMKALGETIEEFILDSFPADYHYPKGNYDGSLAHLVKLANYAEKVMIGKKYLIVIDEFDEIHQDLYLSGNLAETLFANIRAISRCKNICISLVGGENMPFIMDRQGQKLNNFSRINLSYYSRATDWEDFCLLVRSPTEGVLTWHDEAISEIFNASNGNPYFAKIICAQATRGAVAERDADISSREVLQALESEVSLLGANFFSHMWRDGISKPLGEQEPEILLRMRVLVAIARCVRRGLPCTPANIVEHRSSTTLSGTEIMAVLNDFVRREVLIERNGEYSIVLPIFRMWLADVGVSQLVSDSMSEELANAALAEENAATVKSEEVVALVKDWPTYRGRRVGTDEVRAWLSQVTSAKDQRILFKLLQRTRFFSEAQVRERLATAHSMIRRSFPEFILRKKNEKRNDVLVTYVDGPAKSGASYAMLYAEENNIPSDCVISPGDFGTSFKAHCARNGQPSALIIADDIAATGNSLSETVVKFVTENAEYLDRLKVTVIALVATTQAEQKLVKSFEKLDSVDINFRACEILGKESFAFPEDGSGWTSTEEMERAKALCTNLGSRIHKARAMGYGGQALLVVFPTTVPNNSMPILHSYARASSGFNWSPLFARPSN